MTYSGIFIRQATNQTINNIGVGDCSSPDIITDTAMPEDPGIYTQPANYQTMYPNDVSLNNENFVYIRGLQVNNYTGGSNFFFYYVESDLTLWPKNWTQLKKVTVGTANPPGTYQNWAYASPADTASGQILVNAQPLLWTPDPPASGTHYCTIAWADNSTEDNPIPPDFDLLGQMQSFDDILSFLGTHPNMGWLNTNDVLVAPPGATYQTSISTQAAETVNITVTFDNITGGPFTVNLVGDVNYTSGQLDVANFQGGFRVPSQSFPANTRSTLQVICSPTNQSPFQKISSQILQIISPSFRARIRPLLSKPGFWLPVRRMRLGRKDGTLGEDQEVVVLGQQTWNLKFNQ